MLRKLFRFWPVIFLTASSVWLFIANYQPGTYLLGWDNTAPELNLSLNFQRFFFGIWQEYRGLGTLDGMAHVSNLMHLVYAAILSTVFGESSVRYVFNIAIHLAGGLGMYFLLSAELLPRSFGAKNSVKHRFSLQLASLLAAWLYMHNLMTVQMFYTPLELFSTHFALLPWSILTLQRYLRSGTPKDLAYFFLVSVLGLSQAHVPTIVIPYAFLVASFLTIQLLQRQKYAFKRIITAGLLLICVNAFWGVPYLYSTLHKSGEIATSKQNRLGTSGTFFRNMVWGDPKSLASFGGFQLDYYDWNAQTQTFESIMKPWVELYQEPTYQIVSIIITIVSLVGAFLCLVQSIKYRSWRWVPLLLSWLFVVAMLGTSIPIVGSISAWLRDSVPLFAQVFRFTFTKFSLLYVCLLSIFFGVAVYNLFVILDTYFKLSKYAAGVVVAAGLLFISHLSFQGNFFYSRLKVHIPNEYHQLFEYLDTHLPDSRITGFPIHSLWGWTTSSNQWGYRGSGFIWQAIRQPLVDRSFDPWSKDNETMFLQLSYALYRQDAAQLLQTLQKYHSDVILHDKSIFHPGNYAENLFTAEIEKVFSEVDQIKPLVSFGPLQLLAVDTAGRNLAPYISEHTTAVQQDYSSNYTVKDQAYADHGNYALVNSTESIVYPFSFLQQEAIQPPTIENNQLVFTAQNVTDHTLTFPEFSEEHFFIPGTVMASKANDELTIEAELQLPSFERDDEQLTLLPTVFILKIPTAENSEALILSLGDAQTVSIDAANLTDTPQLVTRMYIETPVTNDIQLTVQNEDDSYTLPIPLTKNLAEIDKLNESTFQKNQVLTVRIPLGESKQFIHADSQDRGETRAFNCRQNMGQVQRNVRGTTIEYLANDKGIVCDRRYFPELSSDIQYLFHWTGETVSGAGLRAQLLNPYTKRFDLDVISSDGVFDSWYSVYPTQNRYVDANDTLFSVSLNGESYGKDQNVVNLSQLALISVPLEWLTSLQLKPTADTGILSGKGTIKNTQKWGTTFYSVQLEVTQPTMLVLPQSFDSGWMIINTSSFLHILPHYVYNGWANAWKLPQGNYTVLIVYWPQLIVFAGFGLLITAGIYVISGIVTKRRTSQKPQVSAMINYILRGET